MRLLAGLICLATTLTLSVLTAGAHSHKHKSLHVVHPWTKATAPGIIHGDRFDTVVFMKIRSKSDQTDRLLSANATIADKAEIVTASSGAATADAGIQIAKTQVELSAAGPHIRLVGLKKRLDPYDSFELTLVFERAGAMTVEVLVED